MLERLGLVLAGGHAQVAREVVHHGDQRGQLALGHEVDLQLQLVAASLELGLAILLTSTNVERKIAATEAQSSQPRSDVDSAPSMRSAS